MRDFSTQFFIMRNEPALIDQVLAMIPDEHKLAEDAFFEAFTRKFGIDRVLRMAEREPVMPANRYWCHAQDLYCQHWPPKGTAHDPRHWWDPLYVRRNFDGKRETLQRYPHIRNGENLNRLLNATDLTFYNEGAIRY